MIPHTQNSCKLHEDANSHLPTWQLALQRAVRDPRELLDLLDLPESLLAQTTQAHRQFPLLVPRYFVDLMEKGNPHDPLLLQILPSAEELIAQTGYSTDPVDDINAMKQPGLLHKYHGRVLLTTTPACAVHCRYCFRRHFPYHEANPLQQNWSKAINYIQGQQDINEVILSGGDPLSLNDERLLSLINKLESVPHLSRLRIHTRQPVMLPSRITSPLLEALQNSRFKIIMVIHANHQNELSEELKCVLHDVHLTGTTLLNQSVLLRGVNNCATTLANLSERLFECGVLPYYLHTLDKVEGAHHFNIPRQESNRIYTELRGRLPGYLVPKLVTEISGEPAKTIL